MVPGAASGVWLRNKQRGGVLREGVGNGGFSLRSVEVGLLHSILPNPLRM